MANSSCKKIAILQSNYIPWKGYFDLIAAVDEFIIYDDVQFTKNDWRNRNKIKTQSGVKWISVPVGQKIDRKICEVEINDQYWQEKHWGMICQNYKHAKHFERTAKKLESFYLNRQYQYLSVLNRDLIEFICKQLNIKTKISNSWDYESKGDRTERLVNLCKEANGTIYISGPSAKNYIDEELFVSNGIDLIWFDYEGYKEYPQLYGAFEHSVSILDLIFNCGEEAHKYMRYVGGGDLQNPALGMHFP